MNCTVDASVFVSAVRLEEIHYAASREFLKRAQARSVAVFCPTLVLPECAAAIVRPTGDAGLAEELVALLASFPALHLIAIDSSLAQRAAQIAIVHHLKGANSIYVAVAEVVGATLVTWDAEVLQRSPSAISTITPARWLERYVAGEV